ASVESVVEYVADLAATRKASTIERRLAAIGEAHREVGLPSPTDDDRIRIDVTRMRWHQRRSTDRTVPLAVRELRAMIAAMPGGLVGARDRALLLLGYGAGLRPSELVTLDVSDLSVIDEGLAVSLMRGRVVIPYGSSPELCAVTAWQEWALAAGLANGPALRAVDRHGRLGMTRLGEKSVTRIVRRAAERAGLDEQRYSALSLRLGMVTAATDAGAPDGGIMAQTGHRSRPLVRRYMREANDPSA
ncbi:MAG TPA: tyrosine-type recombinase/integrase, partial [Acidimicrobiia bacterium]|nr:tyrosine-type recombinase/integrase [Acidimicrobiia bacterium]